MLRCKLNLKKENCYAKRQATLVMISHSIKLHLNITLKNRRKKY